MKYTLYYRTSHGANKTNTREGEFNSIEDAKTMALKAIKAKYPTGVLLNVVDSSEAVEPVDLDRVFAFYYRLKPRSSEAGIGRVVADTLADAKRMAKEAIANAFPDGSLMTIGLAKNSPYPAKNAHGVECAPSLVY